MSKFLKHFPGSIFRRKCLHSEHTPACFMTVIVGIKCYKCNLFDVHINDDLCRTLRSTSKSVGLIGRNNHIRPGQQALQSEEDVALAWRQLGIPLQVTKQQLQVFFKSMFSFKTVFVSERCATVNS